VTHERDQETLAVQWLTVAHHNCERMLVHMLNQWNEAWHEENILRAHQVGLEQQLAAAEEYNDNLHEEVHLLHNQLHPLLPDDNDDNTDDEGMGSGVFMAEGDDDIEINGPEDVPPEEEEDEEPEPASDENGGEIFDMDSEDDA
jgi:hypothetical protein